MDRRAVVPIRLHPCGARLVAEDMEAVGITELHRAEAPAEADHAEGPPRAAEILRDGIGTKDSSPFSRRAPSKARTPFHPSPPHRQEAPKGASCPP